jgi:hypothetical protein
MGLRFTVILYNKNLPCTCICTGSRYDGPLSSTPLVEYTVQWFLGYSYSPNNFTRLKYGICIITEHSDYNNTVQLYSRIQFTAHTLCSCAYYVFLCICDSCNFVPEDLYSTRSTSCFVQLEEKEQTTFSDRVFIFISSLLLYTHIPSTPFPGKEM